MATANLPTFTPGTIYRRRDLHYQLEGQRQGRIVSPISYPVILLITRGNRLAVRIYESFCLRKVCLRFTDLALTCLGDAAFQVRLSAFRIEPDGRGIIRYSLVVVVLLPVNPTAVAVRRGIFWVEPDGLGETTDRQVEIFLFQSDFALGEHIQGFGACEVFFSGFCGVFW